MEQDRKRRNISEAERQAIFKAWNKTCAYCENNPSEVVDHIVPFAKGGACELENFAACCTRCNQRKRDHEFAEGYVNIILAIAANKAKSIRKDLEQVATKTKKTKKIKTDSAHYLLASHYGDWTDKHSEIIQYLENNNTIEYRTTCSSAQEMEDIFYVFSVLLVQGNKSSTCLEGIDYYPDSGETILRIRDFALSYYKMCMTKEPKANEIISIESMS